MQPSMVSLQVVCMYGTTGTDTQLTLLEQLSHLTIGGPCYSLLKGNVMMKSKPTKQQLLKRFDDKTDDRTTYVNRYTAYGAHAPIAPVRSSAFFVFSSSVCTIVPLSIIR